MEVMSYSEVRKNLASAMDRVNENHMPLIITRQNGTKAVLVGFEDYASFQESLYLMSNPFNAQRINEGIREVEKGLTTRHDLIEP